MSEKEQIIRITNDDIDEANRLSLNCPLCASAVERHASDNEMAPVLCLECETLYHYACWVRNGNRCAVLGCSGTEFRRYGVLDLGPVLTIERRDIPKDVPRPVLSPNGRTKRLKEGERRMQREVRRKSIWRDLWHSLLRAIRLWPSDPS
jgi:hypothetical protein